MRPVVLIIDDVPDLLQLMEEAVALALPDHDVETATSGAEGYAAIASLRGSGRQLAMVLADQLLGDSQGLEVLAAAKPTGARLVLVTGRAGSAVEMAAADLGATVLWKPFRLQELLAVLRDESIGDPVSISDVSSLHELRERYERSEPPDDGSHEERPEPSESS